MSELPLPIFSFCCIYLCEKRDLLTLHGWGSCEDLVKLGECCIAVVISLGLTIYLFLFPLPLFTKVLCKPVHVLHVLGNPSPRRLWHHISNLLVMLVPFSHLLQSKGKFFARSSVRLVLAVTYNICLNLLARFLQPCKKYFFSHLWRDRRQFLCTEVEKMACTWFGEICCS